MIIRRLRARSSGRPCNEPRKDSRDARPVLRARLSLALASATLLAVSAANAAPPSLHVAEPPKKPAPKAVPSAAPAAAPSPSAAPAATAAQSDKDKGKGNGEGDKGNKGDHPDPGASAAASGVPPAASGVPAAAAPGEKPITGTLEERLDALRKRIDARKQSIDARRQANRDRLRARWGGLVALPAVADELRIHGERVARLQRIQELAQVEGKPAIAARAGATLARENARHERKMASLASAGGAR